jgi:hypothetical protein
VEQLHASVVSRVLVREKVDDYFADDRLSTFLAVRSITMDGEKVVKPRDENGAFATELFRQITSRQWGIIPDKRWTVTCA